MKPIILITLLLTLFMTAAAFAQVTGIKARAGDQEIDLMSPEAEDAFRAKYEHTRSLPDGIAFIETARMFEVYASRDSDGGLGYFSRESVISLNDAENIFGLSSRARADYDAEVAREQRKVGCTREGSPKVYGNEVYDFFNSMDDKREIIGQRYYESVLAQLDPKSADLFRQWVDERKSDILYIKFDHKKVYERINKNADAVLAKICLSS